MNNNLNSIQSGISKKNIVALLIDGENTSARQIEKILAEAEKLGEVKKRYVYGDWGEAAPALWKEIAFKNALELRQCNKVALHKNSLDIMLVVDAMDLFYNHQIRHFCIASSDSDFAPMALYLRREGCVVLGMGRSQTPQSLQDACSMFVNIDTCPASMSVPPLAPLPPVVLINAPADESALTNLLRGAYYDAVKLQGGSEWVTIQYLGTALVQLAPDFKTLYGLNGKKPVAKLVESREDLFEIRKVSAHLEVRLRKEADEKAFLAESA
jgi:hypothetical protein